MSASCSGKIATEEDESAQVIMVLAQHPLLEAGRARVELVPAVVNFLAADHHENDVGARLGDPVGDLHEQVEAPDRLQTARDERDDARARRNHRFADPPRRGARVIELGLDPVKMDLDLGVKSLAGTTAFASGSPSSRRRNQPGVASVGALMQRGKNGAGSAGGRSIR